MDSFRGSSRPEQHPQDLSQMHSGMSEHPTPYSQRASSISNDFNLPASCSQARLPSHPQLPSETNSFYFSQQHWDSSVIQSQPKQSICKSNSSPHIKVQLQLTDKQRIQTSSHQDQNTGQKQAGVSPLAQQGKNITEESQISGGQESPSGDATTSSSSQLDLVTASSTVTPPEPEAYVDTRDPALNDPLSQSCDSKYPSFFLSGQLHGFHPSECVSSGVRPVQSCQDYTEDTSSSDDEGKLIIEL